MSEPEGPRENGRPVVFISHAHQDRDIASDIAEVVRLLGFVGFVAHRDIGVNEEWEAEVLRNLRECACLVIVGSAYSEISPWVNQEVGFVFGANKPVVPILHTKVPGAMARKFQAMQWSGTDRLVNLRKLYEGLSAYSLAPVTRVLEGLSACRSQEETELVVTLLLEGDEMSADEVCRLAVIAGENEAVGGSDLARERLSPGVAEIRDRLPADLALKLETMRWLSNVPGTDTAGALSREAEHKRRMHDWYLARFKRVREHGPEILTDEQVEALLVAARNINFPKTRFKGFPPAEQLVREILETGARPLEIARRLGGKTSGNTVNMLIHQIGDAAGFNVTPRLLRNTGIARASRTLPAAEVIRRFRGVDLLMITHYAKTPPKDTRAQVAQESRDAAENGAPSGRGSEGQAGKDPVEPNA